MTMKIAERTASLKEAGARIPAREGKGARYRIRAMGWEPGAEFVEGSSGRYPVAAIKRDFNSAYPVGTRMKANHDGFCEAGGDIRRLMAKTVSGWEFEADGAYTNIQVSPEWDGFMEDFGDVIGISIAAGVELEDKPEPESYSKDGEPLDAEGNVMEIDDRAVVKRFLSQEESPYNSIDFVEAPGADGRVIALLESAKGHFENVGMREAAVFASRYLDERRAERDAHQTSETAPSRNIKKENAMDEQLQEAIEAAATRAAERAVESLKPAPAETPEIRMQDVAEAAFKAGLTEGSREAVYARVDGGQEATEAIEAEAAREAEIEARVKAALENEQGLRGFPVAEGAGGSAVDAEYQSLLEATTGKKVI